MQIQHDNLNPISPAAQSGPPQPDDWDLRVVPMLWFFGTLTVAQGILELWLPSYVSNGIAFFIAGLVLFRFRGARWARYDFGKWAAFSLLVSAGAWLLHLLLSALPGYLSLGILVFIGGLALFSFSRTALGSLRVRKMDDLLTSDECAAEERSQEPV